MERLILTSVFFLAIFLPVTIFARIHELKIENDDRRYIALSTFGFYKGGYLSVHLNKFHPHPLNEKHVFGFSLDRTLSDAMNPYLDSHQDRCLLEEPGRPETETPNSPPVVYFTMDLKNLKLNVTCSRKIPTLHVYLNQSYLPASSGYPGSQQEQAHSIPSQVLRAARSVPDDAPTLCSQLQLPMTADANKEYFNASFVMYVATEAEEGLYNLYFHSCPNYHEETEAFISFTMEIEEKNRGNYLSAGEMPLPALYFMMAILFFLSGCFWVFILRHSKHPVYKILYLMAVLVFLKSLSLLFHGINFHFIQTKGAHVAAWAILFYVTHLLKGAVLFITIVLIGTGWTFIKYILSEKDKKIFMIVIPLQVLANVAEIIIEESEEGDIEHRMWREVFFLVDLICCGAILCPVVWSIRHLQEASETDGKAAINLRKLKLFRHFYIMIVCYIYFTRIIVYLLKMTVPFQYEWLDEMFREMATYVFYVLTGYKFRPTAANPYFQVNTEEEDDEEQIDMVITETGLTEGLAKISRSLGVPSGSGDVEEDRVNLLSKRESSHEYD
ncbi:Protein GPR107 [Frankliniella fusca]|uniref:Protein GPR107 n=1 Tax=Frankliniella fusca TaxID=407009 RepID=A0AAE1LH81_9NEOP|nr:Protein GPR107 [Frankliniella fusca]